MKLSRFKKQILAVVMSLALVITGFAFMPSTAKAEQLTWTQLFDELGQATVTNTSTDSAYGATFMGFQTSWSWGENSVWHGQAIKEHIPVTGGQGYKLSLDLETSAKKNVRVQAFDGATYFDETYEVNTTRHVDQYFTVGNNATEVKVVIAFGSTYEAEAGTYDIEISDMTLSEAVITTQPETTDQDGYYHVPEGKWSTPGNFQIFGGYDGRTMQYKGTGAYNDMKVKMSSYGEAQWATQIGINWPGLVAGDEYDYTVVFDSNNAVGNMFAQIPGESALETINDINVVAGENTFSGSFTAGVDPANGQIMLFPRYAAAGTEFDFKSVTITPKQEPTSETESQTETTTEETTTQDPYPMTALTAANYSVISQAADSRWLEVGGYEVYIGDWNGTTGQAWVDSNDSDHIKVQQLSSLWYDGWGFQIQKRVGNLNPGETYTYTVDVNFSDTNGDYIGTSIPDKTPVVAGDHTITMTTTADANGDATFSLGAGWIGTVVVMDFSNPVVKDEDGEQVYPATPIDWKALNADNFTVTETETDPDSGNVTARTFQTGGYESYVGYWQGSSGQAWVDSEDSNHIKIQQLSSNWSNGWGFQLKKTVAGLQADTVYTLTLDVAASKTDGKYITSFNETDPIVITKGTQKVRTSITTDANGVAEFVVGLGYLGLSTVLDVSNPVVSDAGYWSVGDFKAGESGVARAPQREWEVFAGWFEDDSYDDPYTETTGLAVPKFINKAVLGPVGFQEAKNGSGGVVAVRFLSTLDSTDYKAAGFIIGGTYGSTDFSEKVRPSTKLYTSVMADGEKVFPEDEFWETSKYFFTYTVSGLNPGTNVTFTATPYIETLDGTTVTGPEGTYNPSN